MNNKTVEEGKTLALVAYLTLLGTLISFFMNQEKRNPFTSFHIRQGLGLGLTYILLGFLVSSFDSFVISMSFWLFFAVLYIYGIFGAITGKLNKIPLLGDFFQNFFKPIGQ
ncbi:hypothetical protein DFQ11_102387 [Winogradskyella epiphytica]|uniref:Tic20 family protein n=1 Tax=Winogradskyella epiphytica TaxID=262005 RepID=A0A2V4WX37_9FLAO|nr:hypothetical protein [Winogradskyella epiphytica]PYE81810.1 hypothetical protein DFQ11_102387 [Winogradskyella epiphytica]GGW62454.1 hypothetical protein GCM10008085_12820 [Winogradskyella epiphytica]